MCGEQVFADIPGPAVRDPDYYYSTHCHRTLPAFLQTQKWIRSHMEHDKAKDLLGAERARVEQLLEDIEEAAAADRGAANQTGDMYDSAEPLTTEGTDDSVRAELEERLAAIERAERRLEAGTYGYSVRSGQPIPDDRLEADPTAELTVEESV